jgi:hypothetical protein
VLTKIFGPKRDELRGEGRKFNSEILHDLYASSITDRLINPKECDGRYVARNGGEDAHRGFWWGKVTESVHLENLGVMGKIMLMYVFKE